MNHTHSLGRNFPIALKPGETWQGKAWGHSRPDLFESVDTNCHLYLEMKALAFRLYRQGPLAKLK